MKDIMMWLINRKKIEQEQLEEDKQYNDRLIDIRKLNKRVLELETELEHQKQLKKIYLSNCKNWKRKYTRLEEELERERSLRLSVSRTSRAKKT